MLLNPAVARMDTLKTMQYVRRFGIVRPRMSAGAKLGQSAPRERGALAA
jgi:hypothetical protein